MSGQWTWKSRTAVVAVQARHACTDGVLAAAQQLLADADALVPFETGGLESSGVAEVSQDGATHIVGQVVFGTNANTWVEALVQHERTDFGHPVGQAKYLEQPLLANKKELLETMAAGVREKFGGHE